MRKVTLQAAVERVVKNAGGVRKLAKLVDVSPGYISDMRHGRVKYPSLYVCKKMGIVRNPDYYLQSTPE